MNADTEFHISLHLLLRLIHATFSIFQYSDYRNRIIITDETLSLKVFSVSSDKFHPKLYGKAVHTVNHYAFSLLIPLNTVS